MEAAAATAQANMLASEQKVEAAQADLRVAEHKAASAAATAAEETRIQVEAAFTRTRDNVQHLQQVVEQLQTTESQLRAQLAEASEHCRMQVAEAVAATEAKFVQQAKHDAAAVCQLQAQVADIAQLTHQEMEWVKLVAGGEGVETARTKRARTEEATAFALQQPVVVVWM